MDYEKPFNDDRPMTVGDARMLKQYVSWWGCTTATLIMLMITGIGVAIDSAILALYGWFSAVSLQIDCFAIGNDGYSRSLLRKLTDINYPPLFDDELSFGADAPATTRGDD